MKVTAPMLKLFMILGISLVAAVPARLFTLGFSVPSSHSWTRSEPLRIRTL